jgi:hypothetical protein
MLEKLFNFFTKKKIKKVSYTFEDATHGVDSIKRYDYKLKSIVDKTKKSEQLTIEEVNYLVGIVATKNKPLESVLYNIIPEISNTMTLQMCGLELTGDPTEKGTKVYLVLKDISHGLDFFVKIEAKDFDEILTPYKQPILQAKEDPDAVN